MEKQFKRSWWNKGGIIFLLGSFLLTTGCDRKPAFEIVEAPFGKLSQLTLKNNETGEYVSLVPTFGATLNQVALRKGEKVYELVDGCKTYEALLEEGKNTFKGSSLFPFPNRIKGGRYSFEGKEYQLPLNFPQENNAIHGLLLTEKFTIVAQEATAEKASVTLQYSYNRQFEGYPFKCMLTYELELSKEGFICKTTITNTDTTAIPVGQGWHPYFKTGSKVDELVLKIPSDSLYLVDDRMVPTLQMAGVNGYNTEKKIGSDKFDTGYKVKNSGMIATTEITDPAQNIKLVIWQETGLGKYNFLQVYTPPSRHTIAVEPMTCLADAFNNQQGLITLKPSETVSASFGVKLE